MNHRFQPGWAGGPGRPAGSVGGRTKALRLLDDMLAEPENQELLRAAMLANFKANPLRFFRQIVMPLLPQEAKLQVESGGVVEWKSILATYPAEKSLPPASPPAQIAN